jgi:hypothetical protein
LRVREKGGGFYRLLSRLPFLVCHLEQARETMKNTKSVVKVNRGGTHAPEYVQCALLNPTALKHSILRYCCFDDQSQQQTECRGVSVIVQTRREND